MHRNLRSSRRPFAVLALLTALSFIVLPATSASAVITTSPTADSFASAIAADPGVVTGASWATLPPNGTPNAVSTTALTSFPRNGSSFGIMTTGDASLAANANSSGNSGADDGGFEPTGTRGNSAYDVSVLKVDVAVPSNANCLSIDFQFLSEEYPEYLASNFNDAFIAEMDTSDWTTSNSTISAPHNFAFDPSNNVISINSTGNTAMTAEAAAGTTYDGATPILSAQVPVTQGPHSLYLSIFDQGDASFDSAVFLDNLVVGQAGPSGCVPGATLLPLTTTKDAASSTVVPSGTAGYTIHVANPNATAVGLSTITDRLPAGFTYQSGSTSGVVSTNPDVSSQTLTWNTPGTSVPANGSVDLSFLATAPAQTGDYYNNAAGTSADVPVTPSGDTALVTVVNDGGSGTPCPASAPSEPLNVQAYPGNGSAALTWSPPASDGGAPIDSYTVNTYTTGGGFSPIHAAPSQSSVAVSGTSAQITGLTNGTTYAFTVQATNCASTGPGSALSNEVTPTADSSAVIIGEGKLSQRTGTTNEPTGDDTTLGVQSFPAGTTGVGTLAELDPGAPLAVKAPVPLGQFCGGSSCIGNILQAELHNGSLGPDPKGGLPFYKLKLKLDRTLTPTLDAVYRVWYDGNLEDDNNAGGDLTPPFELHPCRRTYTGTPCILRIRRTLSFDLKIVVKTSDIDPRMSTSR